MGSLTIGNTLISNNVGIVLNLFIVVYNPYYRIYNFILIVTITMTMLLH